MWGTTGKDGRTWWRWSLGIALLAAVVRVLCLAATSGYRPRHDDRAYEKVARTILLFGRFPIRHLAHAGLLHASYRPPGWPLVLAGSWWLGGISVQTGRIALLVLGVATCVLGAQIARRIGGSRAGIAAGLLLAVDPLLLTSSTSLESEALFTAILLAAVLAALRARQGGTWRMAALAGALIGAAALTRTNALFLIPVVGWLVLPSPRPRDWPRRSLAAVCAACLVIAPWTIRNAVELHHFVPVSTETGNTLAGTYNNASLHHDARWLEPTRTGAYRAIYRRYFDGPPLDSHLQSAVLTWIGHHPLYPLEVTAWNTARLLGLDGPGWASWSVHTMSLRPSLGVPVWLGSLLITALAAAELVRRRRRAMGLVVVAAVLLVSTAPVTGEMRLAIPLQALLAVLGACTLADGLDGLWVRLRREERRRDVALA